MNSLEGVTLHLEGPKAVLDSFLSRLEREQPPFSRLRVANLNWIAPDGARGFEIRPSSTETTPPRALVPPDIATCADCLRELFDSRNRRYRYPFINCTNCGPRYSIIEKLPYDRPNTTMQRFALCPECTEEYENPLDRRFHAQPNACPRCGPHLEFWNASGEALFACDDAVRAAANALQRGAIVAVKGIGGFHLAVLAHDARAVRRLRERKHREEKPFALMHPSLESAREDCAIGLLEAALLQSPEAPIVLLRRRGGAAQYEGVAPGNPRLGVMLPANPLYHLLMAELQRPLVVTSGNLSEEPICLDECEAVERLGAIADFLLVHNRPIIRQMDDSVAVVVAGREMLLRRARGYAPLPIELNVGEGPMLALGGHLKNTVALAVDDQAFVSQHIGDLETEKGLAAFRATVRALCDFHQVSPSLVASDLHPDYLSTHEARKMEMECRPVQHHVAHIFSCMAENHVIPPLLGVAWDGTGLGTDGTIWGGEFFLVSAERIERIAHLRTFPLPGGDSAAREPRYAAAGLLFEVFGPEWVRHAPAVLRSAFSDAEIQIVSTMLSRNVRAPRTSSVGRLFDAFSSLCGLRQRNSFEGQAALALEFAAPERLGSSSASGETGGVTGSNLLHRALDWEPLLRDLLTTDLSPANTSARLHGWLVDVLLAVARHCGPKQVCLSGGCFQNCCLTELALERLISEGFIPYWHRHIPPNDGGLSLGQIAAAFHPDPLPRL